MQGKFTDAFALQQKVAQAALNQVCAAHTPMSRSHFQHLLTLWCSSRRIRMLGCWSTRFCKKLRTPRRSVSHLSPSRLSWIKLTNGRLGVASPRQCHHDSVEGPSKGTVPRLAQKILHFVGLLLITPRYSQFCGELHYPMLQLRRVPQDTTNSSQQTQPCPRIYSQARVAP